MLSCAALTVQADGDQSNRAGLRFRQVKGDQDHAHASDPHGYTGHQLEVFLIFIFTDAISVVVYFYFPEMGNARLAQAATVFGD